MSRRARVTTILLLAVQAACGSSEQAPSGTGGTRPGDGGNCDGSSADRDAAKSDPDAAPPDPDAPSPDRDASLPDAALPDPDASSPDAPPPGPGDCRPVVASHPIEGAQHMPICSPLTYGSNPPSSGNHYAVWADYRTYERPILRGFWVHSMEHGAMVITYNCAGGCPDEVAAARAFIDGLPADCGPMARRVILAPDPELDVRFAGSAWGYTLRANCFDRDAFAAFYDAHYDHAPESICGGGTDPTELCGSADCP